MNRYSPSALSVFKNACPLALKFYRDRKQDRCEFDASGPVAAEIGIAAHACLNVAGRANKDGRLTSSAMEAEYVAQTRVMTPALARIGYGLAKDFVLEWQFPEWAEFEYGVAFDEKWKRVAWDSSESRFRLIYDAVGLVETSDEEAGTIKLAVSQDYKTGWAVGEHTLNDIQMSAQAVGLRKLYPDADAIEVQVVGLRYHETWKRRWLMDKDEDKADLFRREKEIELEMQAADLSDGKPRIGLGCAMCQWATSCEAFAQAAQLGPLGLVEGADPVVVANTYIAVLAREAQLSAWLRKAVEGVDAIKVKGGSVGFHPSQKRVVMAPKELVNLWFRASGEPKDVEDCQAIFRGLLEAGGISVTGAAAVIKKAAKRLGYKSQKDAMAAESPKIFATKRVCQFGVAKDATEPEEEPAEQ